MMSVYAATASEIWNRSSFSLWELIREKTVSPARGRKNRPTSLSFRLLLTRQSHRSVALDKMPEITADSNAVARMVYLL